MRALTEVFEKLGEDQSKYPVVYALLRFLLAGLTRRSVNTSTSEMQGTGE